MKRLNIGVIVFVIIFLTACGEEKSKKTKSHENSLLTGVVQKHPIGKEIRCGEDGYIFAEKLDYGNSWSFQAVGTYYKISGVNEDETWWAYPGMIAELCGHDGWPLDEIKGNKSNSGWNYAVHDGTACGLYIDDSYSDHYSITCVAADALK